MIWVIILVGFGIIIWAALSEDPAGFNDFLSPRETYWRAEFESHKRAKRD